MDVNRRKGPDLPAVYEFHGHAIVSDDDNIADAQGRMPAVLVHTAARRRFQRELDRAGALVLGRHGHFARPNPQRRNRIVLSSQARGIEKRENAWWWNPAEADLREVLARALPE